MKTETQRGRGEAVCARSQSCEGAEVLRSTCGRPTGASVPLLGPVLSRRCHTQLTGVSFSHFTVCESGIPTECLSLLCVQLIISRILDFTWNGLWGVSKWMAVLGVCYLMIQFFVGRRAAGGGRSELSLCWFLSRTDACNSQG